MYVRYAVGEGIADYAIPEEGQYADYYAAHMGRQAARSLFASLLSNALPDEALKAVNRVEDGGILDLAAASAYTPAVYRLYRAGILTGSTGDGRVFLPEDNIKRSEIAAMVSRVADPSLRRSITVTKWKDTGTVRLNAAGRAFEEQYRDVPEDFAECISILTEGRISTEIMEHTMGKIITEPFPGEDAGRPLNDWFTCLENGDDGCILVSPNQSRTYAYGCLHAPVQLVYVRCGGKQYVLFASDANFTAKVFRLNRDGTVTPGKTLLYGQTSEDGETRTWFDLSDVSLYREYLN